MAIFMLDCGVVSEVSSSLSSLASRISEISSSVNSYDVSCEDDFNFASAKSSIVSNIEACANKIKNTSKLIDNVVNSHTALQGSIASGDFDSSKKSNSKSSSTSVNSGSSSSSSGARSVAYSSAGNSTSGSSMTAQSQVRGKVSGNSNSGISNIVTPINVAMASAIKKKNTGEENFDNRVKAVAATLAGGTAAMKTKKMENSEIADNVSTIRFRRSVPIVEKVEHITSKTVSNDIIDKMKFGNDGYGLVNDKHVISCDGSFGKVGDIITIKQADGQKVECIIGNANGEKNKIDFYVDNNSIKENKTIIDIVKNNVEIINNGQIASPSVPKTKVFDNRVIEVLGEEKEVM